MNENSAFDRFVADQFAQVGGVTPPEHSIDHIVTQARRMRPLPRWLATIKEPPMRISSRVAVGSPMARITALVILMLTLSVLTAGGVVVGASLLPSPAPAAACPTGPGTFVPGPELAQPRGAAWSAQLSDGRVLVVGGEDAQEQGIATAELYEPGTDAFRSAGVLAEPEARRAIALDGDRVLVIPNRKAAAAEVWDPTTESFVAAGSLAQLRGDFTATLLADGRVLVVSGGDADFTPIDSAEIWDPRTGTFGPTGAPLHARLDHSATLLQDGRVLVVGGVDEGDLPILIAEIWDPKTGRWGSTGTMTTPRNAHEAIRLRDGRVLLVGGQDASQGSIADAEVWDPTTETFAPAGRLSAARSAGHSLTLLPDGRVLVVGGWPTRFYGTPVVVAEIWDPATDTFSAAATLLEPLAAHTSALLTDCSVLVFGGVVPTAASERWVPGP